MESETINGLHACKPGNEPIVGQQKSFTVEQKTGKSGKPYLKIKSASADQGGRLYIVRKVDRRAAILELLEAAKEVSIDIARPRDNMACHNGICSKEKCCRCSRAQRFYDAIEEAERLL